MVNNAHHDRAPRKSSFKHSSWFVSILKILKSYTGDIFGLRSDLRRSRMLDYTIKPSYKLVFARFSDGTYRPASVVGHSKKLQMFVVNFYHNKRCFHVRPVNILWRHGNLLNCKISFCNCGKSFSGKVLGNNAPANDGLPTVFFVRKHARWFKVPLKALFLTRKQYNKFYFEKPSKKHLEKFKNEIEELQDGLGGREMQEDMCCECVEEMPQVDVTLM